MHTYLKNKTDQTDHNIGVLIGPCLVLSQKNSNKRKFFKKLYFHYRKFPIFTKFFRVDSILRTVEPIILFKTLTRPDTSGNSGSRHDIHRSLVITQRHHRCFISCRKTQNYTINNAKSTGIPINPFLFVL